MTPVQTRSRMAKHWLNRLGIPLPKRPLQEGEAMMRLPANLDDLATSAVTQEMNKWSQMLAYARAQLALAEIRAQEATDNLEKDRTREFLRLKDLNPGATIKSLYAQIDDGEKFRSKADRVALLDAKKKLLLAVYEGADQCYKVLSRELSRRIAALERRGIGHD